MSSCSAPGAAGLMSRRCARAARGRRVLLVDHADEPGKKILISGGGRCNFTNIGHALPIAISRPTRISPSPRWGATRRRISSRWSRSMASPGTKRRWGSCSAMDRRGRSSQMLVEECRQARGHAALGQPVCGRGDHDDGLFRVTVAGVTYRAPALVLATGGPSIPKMGATGFAYDRRAALRAVHRPAAPGARALHAGRRTMRCSPNCPVFRRM
jgi:predicted flavoprotein YhiN